MKKLLTMMIALIMLGTFVCPVFANESIDYAKAKELVEHFISSDTTTAENSWKDLNIQGSDAIYDSDLNEYGFVFDLENGNQEGYAIVVKNSAGDFVFAEGSSTSSSPYSGYDGKYIYTSTFGYYVLENNDVSTRTAVQEDLIFKDVRSNLSVSESDLIYSRFDATPTLVQSRAVPGEVIKYLPSYSSAFVKGTQQPNVNACQPTSFAMSLMYLHNTGQITIDSGYRSISAMRDEMFDDMWDASLGMCSDTGAVRGLHNFTVNHTNRRIETRNDEFQPDTYFSVAMQEIDDRCPPVLVYRANTMYTGSHACTMVGYKTLNNTTTMGQTWEYAIVVDPWTNPAREVTTTWSSSNIWGYFILYLY